MSRVAENRTSNEIRVGGYIIRPDMVLKGKRIKAMGGEAYRIWSIVKRYDLTNLLVRGEIETLLEEWLP